MVDTLPSHTRVVVIGGGIVGLSVAYHLTKLGWRDVVLMERRQLTCGTTWHAAGLVRSMLYTANLTKLARYTCALYAGLEAETGQATGFKANGSLSIANNAERWEEHRRTASMARAFGVEAHVLTPQEVGKLYPLLSTDDLLGAVFFPTDGQTNPSDTAMALAKGARAGGARIVEGVTVTGILQRNGRAAGVATDRGDVAADVVVNAAGMWGRAVGEMAGVAVPLQACEHFYCVTEPMAGVEPTLPVLRDMDACAYVKEDAGKLLVGAFEPVAKPWAVDGIPADFCFDELPEDIEHFSPVLEAAMHRIPALEQAGIRTFFNGPESFTPDGRYLLGEAPELPGFFLACGFNSIGIQSGGGAGKALAEWIVEGAPPFDLSDVDIRRMQPFQAKTSYLVPRVSEALGLLYAMHWPYRQYETARGIRTSPLHEAIAAQGACFGEVAGWERANWFAPPSVEPVYRYSYGRQNWFEHSAAEHMAVRQAVGLFDQSSFAKLRVTGPDAEAVLQRISANDVGVEPGRIVYTQWLNDRGGIEADLTVTREADDSYLVVTAAGAARRDRLWLERHADAADVRIEDVTDAYAVLSLMGPSSRAVLAGLADGDMSDAAFPFGASQPIRLGDVPVRASRITYVGELGWELYVPSGEVLRLFDLLLQAGGPHGLRLCGYHALDSLRIEKAYRHWGHDITDEDTPIEAGLGFAVKLDKGVDFIGREALLRRRGEKRTRRLVQFLLEDPGPLLYHLEPIVRDGAIVGWLTSGNYGHALGGAVGLGYVSHPEGVDADFVASGRWEIEVACERVPARASLRPLWDPKGERIKA